jgi:mRNA interferase MazF
MGRGDIIWLMFDPQTGHEQAGQRSAIVVSPKVYNAKVGLTLVCPITSQVKQYAIEVAIPNGLPIAGVVLADQIKSLNWRARKAEYICTLPPEITDDVIEKIIPLLE